ncbi:thiol:disulfide interchange protein DsbG [Salinicola sp. JS01]|uniref:thiol:disulfide interchange protein DsbG n=1 Tax=Salinicola sp. JS01 TaxID=3050071 RepID=UPI00255B4F03|nr:thiol:disulfide interchange protein DsbG [Salinicola sp. JS01]WIX32597.1 thiol:disulfide interchange protein DsbG [Salinicola sp. JS01]
MQHYIPRMMPLRLALPLAAGIALAASLPAAADDWPAPIQTLEQQGLTIHGEFNAPGGLKGYAASIRGQSVAAYLTPDGKHAVVGTLIDAQGRDVSAEPLEQLVDGPRNAALWKTLEDHHWVREGDADAPGVVYAFSDPNCPYCRKFWQDSQPWVKSGDVQIRHIVVGVLGGDSPAKAAAILAADDPSAVIAEHYRTGAMPDSVGTDQSEQWVAENTQLMRSAQLHATPAIIYQDDDGAVHKVMGAPSPNKLATIMGSDSP